MLLIEIFFQKKNNKLKNVKNELWVKVQKWVQTITPRAHRGNKYFRAQFWD